MSQNLEPESRQNELDIKILLKILWSNKYTLLFFTIVSFSYSLFYLTSKTPLYTAKSVIEFTFSEGQEANANRNVDLLNFFNVNTGSKSNTIPKITGTEFLSLVVSKSTIQEYLNSYCTYSKPSRRTIEGLLVYFGVLKREELTVDQLNMFKVGCVQAWLSIKEFQYKSIKTPAYELTITHKDPKFAALLANEILKEFIRLETDERIESHKRIEAFFDDYLDKAKTEVEKSEKLVESHHLNNRQQMVDPSTTMRIAGSGSNPINGSDITLDNLDRKNAKNSNRNYDVTSDLNLLLENVKNTRLEFKTLKAMVDKKALDASIDLLKDNYVHSYASPPILPSSPDAKSIIFFYTLIGFFVGVFFVTIKQYVFQDIYALDQLNDFQLGTNIIKLSLKSDLNGNMRDQNNFSIQGFGFLEKLNLLEKKVCIISLCRKTIIKDKIHLKAAYYLGSYLSKVGKKVAVIDADGKIEILGKFDKLKKENLVNVPIDSKLSEPSLKPITSVDISRQNMPLTSEDLKEYDNALLIVDNQTSNKRRSEIINFSDHVIFVAKVGKVSADQINRYMSQKVISKCSGFILVDR